MTVETVSTNKTEIALIMEELGLNDLQFADQIGVNRTTVTRWRNGVTQAPEPIKRLAAQLVEKHREKIRQENQESEEPQPDAA